MSSMFDDYQDRGIKKWQTAFATEQLQASIDKNNKEVTKNIPRLPQQSTREIEHYLERSIKYNKVLEVQLNTLDSLGRVQDHIWGNFRGLIEMDIVWIGEDYIEFADIRHIKIHDYRKWMDLSDCTDDDPFEGVLDPDFESDTSFDEYFNDDFIE